MRRGPRAQCVEIGVVDEAAIAFLPGAHVHGSNGEGVIRRGVARDQHGFHGRLEASADVTTIGRQNDGDGKSNSTNADSKRLSDTNSSASWRIVPA